MKFDLGLAVNRVKGYCSNIRRFFKDKSYRDRVKKGFHEWSEANGTLFLTALAISTFFYIWIHDNSIETFYERVRIEVSGVPEGETVGVYPPTVTLAFRGPIGAKEKFESSHFYLEVPYPRGGVKENERIKVKLKEKHLRVTDGANLRLNSIVLDEIEPKSVELSRDEKVSKMFQIAQPTLTGRPTSGSATIEYIEPKAAMVIGGGSKMFLGWESVGSMLRIPNISVEGKNGSFIVEVPIMPPEGSEGTSLVIDPPVASVSVQITEPPSSRVYSNLPIQLLSSVGDAVSKDVVITPKMASITLSGNLKALNQVSIEDLAVYAELTKECSEENAQVVLTLSAKVPSDKAIANVRIEPATITYYNISAAPAVEAEATKEAETAHEAEKSEETKDTEVPDEPKEAKVTDEKPSLPTTTPVVIPPAQKAAVTNITEKLPEQKAATTNLTETAFTENKEKKEEKK